MPDLATLRDLQRRFREATGPDRGLDECLACSIGGFSFVRETNGKRLFLRPRQNEAESQFDAYLSSRVPAFTNSIDAIDAMIERALPDYEALVRGDATGGFANVYPKVERAPFTHVNPCFAATKPLALCIALVSALIAIEEGKERDNA